MSSVMALKSGAEFSLTDWIFFARFEHMLIWQLDLGINPPIVLDSSIFGY